MAIRNGIFKVRNTSTGEKDEVMLKTTVEQVKGLDKMTGATASAAGTWGLAPAPPKGSQNLALCGGAEYKVLPIEGGGTGANTIAAAIKALFGETAVGSDIKPMYYDGAKLQACADSIGGGGIVAALLEQNGYVKFANGLILQWGTDIGNKLFTLALPHQKSYIVLAITNNYKDSSSYIAQISINIRSLSSFYPRTFSSGGVNLQAHNIFWLAIGY